MNQKDVFLENKRLLFSVAYDMLGSVVDAEDIVEETYLKWMDVNSAMVRHPKAYLVKIATNLAINHLNSARKKREEYFGLWLPEPIEEESRSDDPSASVDAYTSLSIGMMMMLEKLSPQERAVFLLKEVFSYDYSEIAEIMEKSEENCRQIQTRAKQHLGSDEKRFKIDMKVHERLLQEFLHACYNGNMDDLVAMLREDVTLFADGGGKALVPIVIDGKKITTLLEPLQGQYKVAQFLLTVLSSVRKFDPNAVSKIKLINGLPSLVNYSNGIPFNVVSLEIRNGKIMNIYSLANPDKVGRLS
ncbi:MAG: RNA polymerase sigma factor SigJ [Bacteroidota bacterium]|nr:RNA polymerase sigma factor SigJ [Bacteroidota bacterium]